MGEITKLSALAGSFPNVEVEYVDLLGLPYLVAGRVGGPAVDCIGVVLEIFRRAGLGFPDPALAGGGIFEFADLFEKIPEPDHLYDLINVKRDSNHVCIVVRPGLTVSARARAGVHTARVNILKSRPGAECFRVRAACLPT